MNVDISKNQEHQCSHTLLIKHLKIPFQEDFIGCILLIAVMKYNKLILVICATNTNLSSLGSWHILYMLKYKKKRVNDCQLYNGQYLKLMSSLIRNVCQLYNFFPFQSVNKIHLYSMKAFEQIFQILNSSVREGE